MLAHSAALSRRCMRFAMKKVVGHSYRGDACENAVFGHTR